MLDTYKWNQCYNGNVNMRGFKFKEVLYNEDASFNRNVVILF